MRILTWYWHIQVRCEERREVRRGEKWGETTPHHDEDIGPPSIFQGHFQGHPIIPKTFLSAAVKKMKKDATSDTMISSEQLLTNE